MLGTFVRVVCGAMLAALSSGASAALFYFGASLGPEVPGAQGSGSVLVTYDQGAHKLFFDADWSGLSGTTTVAHIHCCVDAPGIVGVAVTPVTLPGFPVGLNQGSYETGVTPGANAIDLTLATSYPNLFLTNTGGGTTEGAEAALIAGMNSGRAYFNIHSNLFPAGEIRGFLEPVPEPGTLALLGLGLGGLMWFARRRNA
jgi:hypothetical protein